MREMGVGWIAVVVCLSCETDTKGGAGNGGASGNGSQSAGGMPSAGGSDNFGGRSSGGGGGTSTGGRAGSAGNATGGSGTGGGVSHHDAGSPSDASTPDGVDAGLVCTITERFRDGCPAGGCPAGTICVIQVGGVAGGGGEYCAPIPSACKATPTCACLGECVCGPGFGMPPRKQECTESSGGTIACDNGIR